jgi:signal transduction histidine kinase
MTMPVTDDHITPFPEVRCSQNVEEILRRNQELVVAGQFAAMVMHEINGPLEAVHNLNYLIQQEADNVVKVRMFSGMLEEQLETLTKLSRQTLSLYRSPETREAIAIFTLAEAALRVHQRKISAKRIVLRKQLKTDVTAEVHAGDILQVFSNLISNAIDALPEKGILCIRVDRCAEEAYVTVADNGPGIPAPILSRIFEPFFTTKRERGTGLGLSISKSIIEKHQGRIRSRSTTRLSRNGTTFRVCIPLFAKVR